MSQEQGARREADLVRRAREGDVAAFGTLVNAHGPRVLALLRRVGLPRDEAEDVAQEVFVRAWRALPSFEARARLSTWLYRIAVNEAKRRLQRLGRAPAAVAIADADAAAPDHAPATAMSDLLARELARLPTELRVAVVLRDVEGMSTADAAEVAGLGEAAFKSRLHRGRTALRDALEPQLADG